MRASSYQNRSNTSNPALAVDPDDETAATLSPFLNGASLRVNFSVPVRQGEQAMLLLKSTGNLDVALLGNMVVHTYLSSSKTPDKAMQDMPLDNQAVSVNLLQAGSPISKVAFTATQPFDQLELQVNGLADISSNVNLYSVYATVSPLPVQLTSFQAKPTPTGVALTWETASEQHNDHFVVERADGTPTVFRALGQVRGGGSSSPGSRYQFTDARPAALSYYRLRQVDLNGTETFGPVVAVKAERPDGCLAAYPTRATETVTIVGAAGAQLGLFDQMGRPVPRLDLALAPAQPLDVRSLPDGIYYVRDAATGQSTRFVKSTTGQ